MRTIKPKRINPIGIALPVNAPKAIYPRLTLNSKELPEIKGWEDGETYYIEMTVRQVSKRTSSESDYSNESTFEIIRVGVDDDTEEDKDE